MRLCTRMTAHAHHMHSLGATFGLPQHPGGVLQGGKGGARPHVPLGEEWKDGNFCVRVLQPGDSLEIIHRARSSKSPSEPGRKWLSQKGVSRETLGWILLGVMWLQVASAPQRLKQPRL